MTLIAKYPSKLALKESIGSAPYNRHGAGMVWAGNNGQWPDK